MRKIPVCLLALFTIGSVLLAAQGTVPTFQFRSGNHAYTLAGSDPHRGGVTTIPVVLVPVSLAFESRKTNGVPFVLDAAPDASPIQHSPIFASAEFGSGGTTQYADAVLRANFPAASAWHTLLGAPITRPIRITVPIGYGYVLSSKKTGTTLGMADAEFVQREIFRQIPRLNGKLILAVTHNTAYFTYGDATVCCSWGTHGVDAATGNSFVLASYLHAPPPIVRDQDVQPLTEQLAEFMMDPERDPLFRPTYRNGVRTTTGNLFPAWLRPRDGNCGGRGIAASYTLLDPTDTNPRSNLPVSEAFAVNSGGRTWHVQNVALLRWYLNARAQQQGPFSFPDARALAAHAVPCSASPQGASLRAAAKPIPPHAAPNGHKLIGYWTYDAPHNSVLRLRDVSPQWDIVIVAFAVPDHSAPEGTLKLDVGGTREPENSADQFRSDIRFLQSHGKKVILSLGGGGQFFSLNNPRSIPNFVSSVARIVSQYGFDGVDIDFETPSLVLDPGDADFRHPTTPSIVNLIDGLHELRRRFGPRFMISLVPEGPQLPAGFVTYGGQFGSYVALLWGVRDILSFVDAQDYNTPPLEGLDGEIYQIGSPDYHVAMTELLLRGFPVAGDPAHLLPPTPANQVATGFLVGATTPRIVNQSMDTLIAGRPAPGAHFRLRNTRGYNNLLGAMFWNIDEDLAGGLPFSNSVGPRLHAYPPAD